MSLDAIEGNTSAYAGELEYQDREEIAKKLAAKVGLRLPDTRVPAGEALWDVGEQAKRRLEHDLNELPFFRDLEPAVRERIAAEDAKDYTSIPIQRVRMDQLEEERPTLYAGGIGEPWGYTKAGLGQVIQYVKPNGVRVGFTDSLLAISDGKLRSEVFNHFAARAHERNKTPVHIRTIVEPSSGLRVVRAVTSEKHSLGSGDDLAVLHAMKSGMPDALKTARMRVTRDLERSVFELLWPALKRQVKTGDIVQIGVRIRNSETKQGALRVEPYVLRTLCYNFTTAYSKGGEEEISIRHVGDLTARLPEVFKNCLQKVEPFVKAFGDAYRVALPGNKTRGEVLQMVKKAFELPETTITRASEMWDADGTASAGDTLAGLINAMTRASQEETLSEGIEVERFAGKLAAEGWAALDNAEG